MKKGEVEEMEHTLRNGAAALANVANDLREWSAKFKLIGFESAVKALRKDAREVSRWSDKLENYVDRVETNYNKRNNSKK